jgi:uncharacterized cupin superfamily protein
VRARLIRQAAAVPEAELIDWGPVSEPLGDPVSRTRGKLLYRDENADNETGLWVCTPGRWRCSVGRAEFCPFLAGQAIYLGDAGERLEVAAGDAAFFPVGWTGICEVLKTIRKTYMIR